MRERFGKLTVRNLPAEASQGLEKLAARGMQIQCLIQDGQIWFSNESKRIEVTPQHWLGAAAH